MAIEIIGTEIDQLEQAPYIVGSEKLPTGGRGLYHVTIDQVRDYVLTYFGKEAILLGQVDNTSDENKPLSKAAREALAKKISFLDPYVRSINGLTGDIDLVASTIGLGRVDNTSDKEKPLSDASIRALDLKLDKTAFKAFKRLYEEFQEQIAIKFGTLDTLDQEILQHLANLELADQSLIEDLEELTNYVSSKVVELASGFSSQQQSALEEYLLSSFDTYLSNSVIFNQEISEIKDTFDLKIATINQTLLDLGVEDERLDSAILALTLQVNNKFSQIDNELLDLENSIESGGINLEEKAQELLDLIDQKIQDLQPSIIEAGNKYKDDLFDFTQTVSIQNGIITQKLIEINGDLINQKTVNQTLDDFIHSKYDQLMDMLVAGDTNLQGLIDSASQAAKDDINDLAFEMNAITTIVDTRYDLITGIVETQVETNKLQMNQLLQEVNDRVDSTISLIDDVQADVDAKAAYYESEFLRIEGVITTKTDQLIADLNQEVIDRNAAIDTKVDSVLVTINQQLENLNLEEINELSQKIDDLNQRIDEGVGTITQELQDYVNNQIANNSTTIMTNVNNLIDDITLEQVDRLNKIAELEDGISTETSLRIAGDNALLTNIENYKVSNDQEIANVRTEIITSIEDGIANSSTITSLDARVQTVEDDTATIQTNLASVTSKANATASQSAANTSTLNTLSATVTTNDTTVKGLIATERDIRTTEIGNLTTQLNTLNSSFTNLNTAGKNLLKQSNVPLVRSKGSYLIGAYTIGEAIVVNQLYTLLACITHDVSAEPSAPAEIRGWQGTATPIPFSTTTKGSIRKVFKATFTPTVNNFSTIGFYYFPQATTSGTATVHWAMLVRGDAAPTTDWIESPFDIVDREVVSNANISNLQTAMTNETLARAQDISQVRTEFQTLDNQTRTIIQTEKEALSNEIESSAQLLDALRTDFESEKSVTSSLVTNEATARTTADQALAQSVSLLQSSFSGSGVNLLPSEYSDPVVVKTVTINAVAPTVEPSTLRDPAVAKQWKIKKTGTGANSYLAFAKTLTTYDNLRVKPNTNYIVSAYVKAGISGTKFKFAFRVSSGLYINGPEITLTTTQTRYSSVLTIPNTVPNEGGYLLIYCDTTNQAVSNNNYILVDMLMVEKQVGTGTTPSDWVSSNGNLEASIIEINKAIATSEASFASQLNALSTTVSNNDTTVKGLIADEKTARTTAIDSVVSQVNSLQASFGENVVGVDNLWWFKNGGSNDYGTATKEMITSDFQHQKLTVTGHTSGIFSNLWSGLRDTDFPGVIDITKPYSVSFEVKASLSKLRAFVYVWGQSNPLANQLHTVPVNTWTTLKFNNLVSRGTNESSSYGGLLGLRYLASDNNIASADLIGQTLEIRNIQLQQGTVTSAYTKPSWLVSKDINQVNAAVTSEATTRANADTAFASQMSSLTTTVSNNDVAVRGLIATETTNRTTAIGNVTSQLNTLQSTFDNFTIGGSNLAAYSDKFRIGTVGNSRLLREITPEGYLKVTIQTPTTTLGYTYLASWWSADTNLTDVTNNFRSTTGISLVFSFWAKVVDNTKVPTGKPRLYLNPDYNYSDFDGVIGNLSSGGWCQFYKVIKLTTTPITADIFPHIQFHTESVNGGLIISRWKLEIGSKPTDWSDYKEMPKVLDSKIDATVVSLTQAITTGDQANASQISGLTTQFTTIPNAGINLLSSKVSNPTNNSNFYAPSPATATVSLYDSAVITGLKGVVYNPNSTSSTVLVTSPNTYVAEFTDLLPGTYILSFYAYSTISNQSLTIQLQSDAGYIRNPTNTSAIVLPTTLTRFTKVFVITVERKYTIRFNVSSAGSTSFRPLYIERMMLEQQYGTNVNPSKWSEGQENSPYSLLPVTSTQARLGTKLDAVSTKTDATATKVDTLETTVSTLDTEINSSIVNIQESISNLAGSTATDVNALRASFKKDNLLSSPNLWVFKDATSVGTPTLFTPIPEEYAYSYRSSSSSSGIRNTLSNTVLPINSSFVLSFKIKVESGTLSDLSISISNGGTVEELYYNNVLNNSSGFPYAVGSVVDVAYVCKVSTTAGPYTITIKPNSGNNTSIVKVSNIQIELGVKRSVWTPAYQDTKQDSIDAIAQINDAKTVAANANQVVADRLETYRTELKGDVAASNADIANLTSTVSTLSNSTATQFNTINSKFSSMPNGGVNLLPMSIAAPIGMPSPSWTSGTSFIVEPSFELPTVNRFTLSPTTATGSGIYFNEAGAHTNRNLYLTAGFYIFSFYAKANSNGHQIRFNIFGTQSTPYVTHTLTTNLVRYSQVVEITTNGTYCPLIITNPLGLSGATVYLERMMLEVKVGDNNAPSVWATDTSVSKQFITTNSTINQVAQTANNANSATLTIANEAKTLATNNHVIAMGEIQDLTDIVSDLDSSTATRFTNVSTQFSNLTSNGKNMLMDSNVVKVRENGSYFFGRYDIGGGVPLVVGNRYTLVFCASHQRGGSDTNSYLGAWINGSQALSSASANQFINQDKVVKVIPFTRTSIGAGTTVQFYCFPNGTDAATTATVYWAMLFEGDVNVTPTDWSQSPYDIDNMFAANVTSTDAKIAQAQQVVTDANSATASNLNQLTTSFNSMILGGDNLYDDPGKFDKIGNLDTGITASLNTDKTIATIIKATGPGNYVNGLLDPTKLPRLFELCVPGDKVCISFDIRIGENSTIGSPSVYWGANMGYLATTPLPNESLVVGKWRRVYHVRDFAAGYVTPSIHFGFAGLVGTYEIRNVKIEKGSRPTPFDSSFLNSIKTIDSKVESYQSATTTALDTQANTLNTVKSSFENMVIGGQNIWSIENAQIVQEFGNTTITWIDKDQEYFRGTITSFSSNLARAYFSNCLVSDQKVSVGDTLTVSFWVRASVAKNLAWYSYSYGGQIANRPISVGTSWQYVTGTITVSNTTAISNASQLFAISVPSGTLAVGGWYEVKQVQLQLGNRPTAFVKSSPLLVKNITKTSADLSTFQGTYASDKVATAQSFTNVRTEFANADTVLDGKITTLNTSLANVDTTINQRITTVESTIYPQLKLPEEYDDKEPGKWLKVVFTKRGGEPESVIPTYSHLATNTIITSNYISGGTSLVSNTHDNVFMAYRCFVAVAAPSTINLGTITNNCSIAICVNGVQIYASQPRTSGGSPVTYEATAGWHCVDVLVNKGTGNENITSATSLSSQVTLMYPATNTKALLDNLGPKVDALVLNNYYTKAGTNEAIAAVDTKLQSKLDVLRDSDSLVADYALADVDAWNSHHAYDLTSYFTTTTTGKVCPTVFSKPTTVSLCYNYSKTVLPNNRAYKVSVWMRRQVGSGGTCGINWRLIKANGISTSSQYGGINRSVVADGEWKLVEYTIDLRSQSDIYPQFSPGFFINHSNTGYTGEVQGYHIRAVISDSDIDSTVATVAQVNTKLDATVIDSYYTKTQADQATAGKITEFKSTLQVGSENLLPNSSFEVNTTGWGTNGTPTLTIINDTSIPTTATKCLRIVASGSSHGIHCQLPYKIPVGTEITFSLWLRGSENGVAVRLLSGDHAISTHKAILTTGWQRYHLTTTVTGTGTLLARIYSDAPSTFFVSRVQYEIGNIPSDWSKAAIDIDTQLNSAATAIDNINTAVGMSGSQATKITNLEATTTTLTKDVSDTNALATAFNSGKLLSTDPTFRNGTGGVVGYSGTSAVRVASSSGNPTTSGFEIKLTSTSVKSPGWAGFQQVINSRANAVFLVKYIIKIPVGWRILRASNSQGTGAKDVFIGSTEGTGNYQTYLRRVDCGSTGTFSTGGHAYFNKVSSATPDATEANPLEIFIASVETYDLTDYDDSPPSLKTTFAGYQSQIDTLTTKDDAQAFKYEQLSSAFTVDGYNGRLPVNPDFSQSNKWLMVVYSRPGAISTTVPTYDKVNTFNIESTAYVSSSTASGNGTYNVPAQKFAAFRTRVYVATGKTINIGQVQGNAVWGLYLNGNLVTSGLNNTIQPSSTSLVLPTGWSTIDVLADNASGAGGFRTTTLIHTLVDKMYAPDQQDMLIGSFGTVMSNYYTKSDADTAIASGAQTISASNVQEALKIPDTRDVNQPPSWYWANYPRRKVQEFKTGSAIGSPGGITGYGVLETTIPWNDSSGGYIIQVWTAGDSLNTHTRFSVGTTGWSAWKSDIKNLDAAKPTMAQIDSKYLTQAGVDGAIAQEIKTLSASIGSDNIITNGNFSNTTNGLYGWRNNSGTAISAYKDANSKTWCLINSTDTTLAFKGLIQTITSAGNELLLSNTKYTLSFLAQGLDTNNKSVSVIIHRLNSANSNSQLGISFTINNTSPVRCTYTFTTIADLKHINIIIYSPTGYAPNFIVTDVMLQQGEVATAFIKSATELQAQTQVVNEAINGPDGIHAKYAVKVNAGGLVSGYGLIADANDGNPTSAFAVEATQFYVGSPLDNKKPFIVLTSPGTINGVSVPAGTYMDSVFIANATIKSAQINSLTTNKIVVEGGTSKPGNLTAGRTYTINANGSTSTSSLPNDGNFKVGSSYAQFGSGSGSVTGTERDYLEVDLGAVYAVTQSVAYWYAQDDRQYYYKIKYSVDGTNWFYFAGNAATNGWSTSTPSTGIGPGTKYQTVSTEDAFYPGVTARYFRLFGNGSNKNGGNHIYEWLLYGTTTTVIDGSQIITNSITAEQIRADAIVVGSSTQFQNGYNPAEINSTLDDKILNINRTVGSNMLPNQFDYSKPNQWAVFVASKTTPYLDRTVIPDYSYLNTFPTSSAYYAKDGNTMVTNLNAVIYHRAIFTVNATKTISLGNFVGGYAHSIYLDGNLIFSSNYVAAGTPVSFIATAGMHVIDVIANNANGVGGFTTPTLLSSQVDSMYAAKIITDIESLDSGDGKIFQNVARGRLATSSTSNTLVIQTPITLNAYMTEINITGYNYTSASDGLYEINLSFYAFNSSQPFPGNRMVSARGINLSTISLALDASNRVVILIEKTGAWSYPSAYVNKVSITHTTPPDSFKGGWNVSWQSNVSSYTSRTYITAIDSLETQAGSQKKVDDLIIGGRNYLLNSSFESSVVGWTVNGSGTVDIFSDTTIPNGASKCLRIQATGSSQGVYQSLGDRLKETNIPITISFWAKGSATLSLAIASLGHSTTSHNISINTIWKKYVVTLTKTSANFSFTMYAAGSGTYYISRVQYETGQKATEWTPAIEDIDTALVLAQQSADTANNLLSDIASDSKLTPVEKQSLKTEWDSIVNEKVGLEGQATAFNVSATAYTNAYNTLNTNVPPLLSDMSVTSNINRTSFQSWFSTYFTARSNLLKAISDSAKGLTDSKAKTFITTPTVPYSIGDLWRSGTTVLVSTVNKPTGSFSSGDWVKVGDVTSENTANDVLTVNGVAAATVATNAQTGATLSSNIMTDLVITPVEKSALSNEWNRIQAEYSNLSTQATAVGVSTTNYTSAYNALNGNTPRIQTDILDSMVTNYTLTTTTRDNFKTQLNTYYVQATAISKAITDAVNTNAANAQSTANSKAKTFLVTPTIPYSSGDIWKDGATTKVCIVTRTTGSYIASDWVLVGDVTSNNTAADTAKVNGVAASTVASNAATGATLAANIMTDLVITPVEKSALSNEWNRIQAEYSNLSSQATALSVSKASLDTAYTALNGTAPRIQTDILASMTTNYNLTTTTRDNFKSQLNSYYVAATALSKALTDKVKTVADDANANAESKSKTFTSTPTVPYKAGDLWRNAGSIFVTTVTRSSGSYTSADWIKVGDVTSENVANDVLTVNGVPSSTVASNAAAGKTMADQIISDLVITPVEKSALFNEWNRIQAEYSSLLAQATALSLVTSTFTTAYNALNGTTPRIQTDVLASMTSVYNLTTSTRDAFKNKINAYYTQATSLSTAINNAVQAAAKDYTDINTGNLVNNVTKSGNTSRWTSGGTVTQQDFLGYMVPVHTVTTTGNVQVYSDWFSVDPSKAYEVSLWMKASNATSGSDYVGLNCNDASGTNIGVELVGNTSTSVSLSTNPYFWSGSHGSHLDWVKRTAYIMPAGTEASLMKGIGTNISSNARMLPTADRIRIRWLNYNNAGNVTTTWVANAKVVEVDPTVVMNLSNSASLVSDISADGKLTPGEKQQLKIVWDSILKEKVTISATASSYALSGAVVTNYNSSYTSLFNTVNPLLANLNTTSDINRTTFNNLFADYYDKRAVITQAIDTAWIQGSTGNIDGGKIANDTITTDQMVLSSGNMIYGGLDNFSNYSSLPNITAGNSTNTLSQDFPLFGPNSIKHVSTSTNSFCYFHPSTSTSSGWLKLETNQWYILSAYVRTTSTSNVTAQIAAEIREGATTTSGGGSATGSLVLKDTDGWKQVFIKFRPTNANPFLSYYIRNSQTGVTTYWTGFMLEKVEASQNKPYHYTQGNITRIDGGNIVTNSIEANKLNVTDLSAISANLGTIKVDTANIADAAITNAKIKELDASKITTGVLNANRVRVGPTSTFEDGYNPATKARTFVSQPTVPYNVGDIWKSDTATYICKQTRVAGPFTLSEWDKTGDVTSENTAANANALGGTAAGTITTDISNAQTTANTADTKATNAQTVANAANNQVNAWKFTGTTEIDGGNIRADTVTAAQISVANLAALDIKVVEADITDLSVSTLKIQDNAVTVPSASYAAGDIAVTTSSWVTVASLFVETSEGSSLIVFNTAYNVSANGGVGVNCRILRNTTVVRDEFQIIAASLVGGNSIRPSGSVSTTYLETGKQNATIHVQMRITTGTPITFSHRSLTSLVVKK